MPCNIYRLSTKREQTIRNKARWQLTIRSGLGVRQMTPRLSWFPDHWERLLAPHDPITMIVVLSVILLW